MKIVQLAVFTLCAAVCFVPKTQAGTVIPQLQNVPQMQSTAIEVRNLTPSAVAYRLDSQQQSETPEMLKMRAWLARQGVMEGVLTEKWMYMPSQPGIAKDVELVPDDKSDTLNVSGEAAAVERVRAAVRALDKETPRLEIEARVVQVPLDSPLYQSLSRDKSVPYVATSWDAVRQLEAAGKLRVIEGWTMKIPGDIPVAMATSSSGRATARFQTVEGFHHEKVTVIKQHLVGFRLAVSDATSIDLYAQVMDGFRLGESIDEKGRLSETLPMQSWIQHAHLKTGNTICFSGAPLSFRATQKPPRWLAKLFPASRSPMTGVLLLIVSLRALPPLNDNAANSQ